MHMKAVLKNYRQQPRKVRLIADAIRGKSIREALGMLGFMPQRAAEPFAKVLRSALANALSTGKSEDALVVKSVAVNKGMTLKRYMPRARGSAAPIHKTSSHITVELAEKTPTA